MSEVQTIVINDEEYKARIEAERTAKVQAQIDRAATQATGVPW